MLKGIGEINTKKKTLKSCEDI